MKEVSADRSVAVFKAAEHDAVFHLSHLGARENRQRIR